MAGYLQEQNGDGSSRRLFSAYFSILSAPCFIIGAINGTMSGIWGGGICIMAVLILSGYTTMSDIKALAKLAGK